MEVLFLLGYYRVELLLYSLFSQKYGELAFLELLTPCEEYTEEEKEQTLIAID